MLSQLLAELLGRHLVDSLVEGIDVPELGDELGRGLLADPGHPGNVVGRIALERLEIDHLAGHEAIPIGNLRGVVDDRVLDPRSRRHETGLVRDELEHVEIDGDDGRLETLLLGLQGQRADDVVRLVALELIARNAERLDDLADLGKLVGKVVGHLCPGGLVVGVLLVAERRAGEVERHRDIVRLQVRKAAQDDAAEPEYAVDELASRRRQRGEREVSAIHEPEAVEQHQAFHGRASSEVPDRAFGDVPGSAQVYRSRWSGPVVWRPFDTCATNGSAHEEPVAYPLADEQQDTRHEREDREDENG